MVDTIPRATADKLADIHPPGTRHKAALDIATALIGSGMDSWQVFYTLRAKFSDPDIQDRELWGIVKWVERARPEPPRGIGTSYIMPRFEPRMGLQPSTVENPEEKVGWWTGGAQMAPDQVRGKSPLAIPDNDVDCCLLPLNTLYGLEDGINIVCRYHENGKKATPFGTGRTSTKSEWTDYIYSQGVPSSEAGAWLRMNPVANGIADADVTAFRYLLIESDTLPLETQLGFLTRLPLPIAMIVLSGGGSAHAWVHLGAENAERYRQLAGAILTILKPFGIDQANCNPSRLSRLPGAVRKIGSAGDGRQALLWVNGSTSPVSDDTVSELATALKWPAIDEQPLKQVAIRAMDRYQEMLNNRGKLGVPYGIPILNKLTGGIKAGQTVVVAGETGCGKTTYALHVANSALEAGYGVAFFSLEMDVDELFDQLVSNRGRIDRNKFNNGEFTEADIALLAEAFPAVSKLPLYIEDKPNIKVEDIALRVRQLRHRIGIVIVDYVQFITAAENERESRERQVAAISHGLRILARESRLPFLVLSQLNDEGKLRESRVIAHNAHVVLQVDAREGGEMKVNVVKGRGIPTGNYTLEYERIFCRLRGQTNGGWLEKREC